MDENISTEQKILHHCVIEGDLHVSVYEEDKGQIVNLYGDPKGLRSLASILNTLADLDQQSVPLRNLPVGEGFHLHLFEARGLLKGSNQLDLGRWDLRK